MPAPKKIDSSPSYEPGNATGRPPVTIDGKSGRPLPTPRKRVKHIRLRSVDDCRREAEKIYRDTRSGRLVPQEATRMVYILSQIVGMIELADIEKRLDALEQQQSTVDEE